MAGQLLVGIALDNKTIFRSRASSVASCLFCLTSQLGRGNQIGHESFSTFGHSDPSMWLADINEGGYRMKCSIVSNSRMFLARPRTDYKALLGNDPALTRLNDSKRWQIMSAAAAVCWPAFPKPFRLRCLRRGLKAMVSAILDHSCGRIAERFYSPTFPGPLLVAVALD